MAINEEVLRDKFPATAGEIAVELRSQGSEREAGIMEQLPPDAMFESLDDLKDQVKELDGDSARSEYTDSV